MSTCCEGSKTRSDHIYPAASTRSFSPRARRLPQRKSTDRCEINIPITRYAAILPVEFPSALRAVCTSDGLGGLDGGCDYDRRRGLCRNTDE
ncbi:hypothetical protein ALC57_00919 [Trachymyrmex cornetzi]|uniref:Uncharacterized protein n=1 Tax=Trachymyrmex cornetzi TaxID=471704 RepID=A0A195ENC3_9HYME|nr:hypothetical protein ALC57_00919 [Trachymyrmex cornetzi]